MAFPNKFPKINQEFLSQLRGLFFSKDNPVMLPNNGFIGLHSIDTPNTLPPFPYRFIYVKADGYPYILDYEGNEYRLALNILDDIKISQLWQSDGGGVAWATNATGDLLGDGDVFPQGSTNGLNARFERLFGDDKPAGPYRYTLRTFAVNNFGSNIAGFEDSQATPYSFGGSPGGFSLSVPASSYVAASNVARHWIRLQNYHATTPLYLQWTSSTAKTTNRLVIAMTVAVTPATDVLVGEIRFWAVQSPGAADKYWAIRWNWYGSTRPQFPMWLETRYGTGVTFAVTDGTLIRGVPYINGSTMYLDTFIIDSGGPLFYVSGSLTEGLLGLDSGALTVGHPVSFKTVRYYVPPVNYHSMWIDEIVIS